MPLRVLLEAFGRVGHGALILDHEGEIRAMNAQGRAVLAAESGLGEHASGGGRAAVQALLARGARRLDLQVDAWTMVVRDGSRPLLLHVIPIPRDGARRGDAALVLIDLDHAPGTNRAAMEQVFGLTPAEARLTFLLAGGASAAEAAAAQGVSLATVRKQLVSIFGKTETRGQVELVALSLQLAILT